MPTERGRKRRNPTEWVQVKKKIARNSAESKKKPFVKCTHDVTFCDAKQLSKEDVEGNIE